MAGEYSWAYCFLGTSYHLRRMLHTRWLVTLWPQCQYLGGERGCGRVVGWGAWVRPAGCGRLAGAPRRRGRRRQQPPRPLGLRPSAAAAAAASGWSAGRAGGEGYGNAREGEGRRGGRAREGRSGGRRGQKEWERAREGRREKEWGEGEGRRVATRARSPRSPPFSHSPHHQQALVERVQRSSESVHAYMCCM